MRLIDADAVDIEYRGGFHDDYVVNYNSFINAPTIDAVEVVRCEKCMFSKVYQNDSSGVMGRFCEAFTQVRMVSDDDFCSYGERKEKCNE